ncbi:MAG TPA: DUF5916 domain-containing protein [Gemmatimonadaceae bacterium]|nr:DUF5916 domain-containing protein [Gemmatimonadaceae bacterium]
MPGAAPYSLPYGLLCVAILAGTAAAQAPSAGQAVHAQTAPRADAGRRTGPITIDGRLDEPAWAAATPITAFRQTQPLEGPPATQRTEIRILYDDDALYIGARMYDSLGARGVRSRLARRDDMLDLDQANSQITSDKLTVTLDPFHDHLTRAVFEINPSGSTGDALGAGGDNLDPSWDPVWQGAARIDSLGWTAEIRIPFSQLRFDRDSTRSWGLQLVRVIDRLNERDQWSFYHKNEASGPSRYGHLYGITLQGHNSDTEILPYALVSDEANGNNCGDPVNRTNRLTARAGADLKYLLPSNLTLDATVNPDFGQVDLDPAVINISAYETYYPEKRPFFVSGAAAFDYGGFNCMFCSNQSSLGLFYSRRIGRFPELGNFIENASTANTFNVPTNTQILGATKITGRTSGGTTVGLLEAVTNEERAGFSDASGQTYHETVEPLSNYLVGRVKQDLGHGATVIGGMVTSTVRRLNSALPRDSLHSRAEAAGLDFITTWDTRNYSLMGSGAISEVGGSHQAMTLTEQSSAHYFQRPDRRHAGGGLFNDRYDTAASSLRGFAGYLRLGKDNGDWLWEGQTNIRSPGFEVNDLAFQQKADYQTFLANVGRQWTVPHTWYRDIFTVAGTQRSYNFDGDLISQQYQAYVSIDWPNFWNVTTYFIHRPTSLDQTLSRGGPVFKNRGINDASLYVKTDSRKAVVLTASVEGNVGLDAGGGEITPQMTVLVKPTPTVTFSLAPTLDLNRYPTQYDSTLVARAGDTSHVFYGRHYIFASVNQTTLSVETRINWTLTPKLTFSLYAQPLLASGHYHDFKEFNHTRQLSQTTVRDSLAANGDYYVFSGQGYAYNIGNRDYNSRSLRANAVLRWEYLPGSTLYLVWQQLRYNNNVYGLNANFAYNRDQSALARTTPDNTFIVKVSYWIGH